MAIIDSLDYLGTTYDIADADARAALDDKLTVPEGGADGQLLLKNGAGFEWSDPYFDDSIVAFGTYEAGDTSCVIAVALPGDNNYTLQVLATTKLTVVSRSRTSTQVTVRFNKQTEAGEICLVARKVG